MGDPATGELLYRWRRNCQRSQIANYSAANRFAKGNYYIGVPSVALSAVVGTSVFAALEPEASFDKHWQILVGLISVVSAVLTALQTFLKWGELAGSYRSTAAEYGSVKRQLDQIIVIYENGGEISQDMVTEIRRQMDTLSREGTEVPRRLWEKARISTPSNRQASASA